MASRTTTRIGKEIESSAHPKQKTCIISVCKIIDNLMDKRYNRIIKLATAKRAEDLLQEVTDFKTLSQLRDGLCQKP